MSDRYGRQIAVRGVGESGHRAIRSTQVRIAGDGIAAEVCACYLAGAGVGRLVVSSGLVDLCRSVNAEVSVTILEEFADRTGVWTQVTSVAEQPVRELREEDDEVGAGAKAARWVLARILKEL